jgi:hypothetical protein
MEKSIQRNTKNKRKKTLTNTSKSNIKDVTRYQFENIQHMGRERHICYIMSALDHITPFD